MLLASSDDPLPPTVIDPVSLPTPGQMLEMQLEADQRERRRFRRAVGIAVAFHVVLLLVTFPSFAPRELPEAPRRVLTVVQTVQFQPPKPPTRQQIPNKKAKKIPIPDPTPADPEPIEIAEQELPDIEVDLDAIDASVFGIPDAPPGPVGPSPMQIAGDVVAPRKVFAPQPRYTEEARQARVQGVVVLQAIVDEEGGIQDVEVLKGLTLGLTESAVETVRQWTFEPATLEGKPVPVYLSLVINFSLQ